MFTSILSSASSSLTIANAIYCVLTSILCGLVISGTYMISGKFNKSFVLSIALLPVLVQVVIMMVNGNLGAGVAVAGAFSLIRFRSVPGNARDISIIFFAMAVGLATGMGYVSFAIAFTLMVCIFLLILSKTRFGEKANPEKELKITIPEDLDYTGVFDDLFATYTKKSSLDKVKTTNLGSMYQLTYSILLKDQAKEKEFIDALRCRNGNLNISCSREMAKEEL